MKAVISSGHGLKIRGAADIIDEVNEARRVVDTVAEYLRQLDVDVDVLHDNTSTTQNANLRTIVNYHNSKARDLDVSVHFNAASRTDAPRGTEVLYYDDKERAENLSAAIASASGLKNRGAKQNKGLYFLANTNKPAVLIEVCFVDSSADVVIYHAKLDAICRAIAETIAGKNLTIASIPKEDDIMSQKFEPGNQAVRDAISTVLMRFEKKEPALDSKWRAKANDGELSISDAVGLLYVAIERGYITGK